MKFLTQPCLITGIVGLGSLSVVLIFTFSPGVNRGPKFANSLTDSNQIPETREIGDMLEPQQKHNDNPDNMVVKRRPEEQEIEQRRLGSIPRGEPSMEYEHIRRKIHNGVTELWYYMSAQLQEHMKDLNQEQTERIGRILENGGHQKRSILTDIYNWSKHDNYDKWREQESTDLKILVKKRLHDLQNPQNCSSAKTIIYIREQACGSGCQFHNLVYGMLAAYATGRTLVIEPTERLFSMSAFGRVFQPLSKTCTTGSGNNTIRWADFAKGQFQRTHPHFQPMAIPEDLSERLMRIHGDPFVWWIGQIMTYLMRPQADMIDDLERTKERLGFQNPIVGVHVRRSDKLYTKSNFHSLREYMVHVEDYYQRLVRRQKVTVKRVYLASDDGKILSKARQMYPEYEFISENNISKTASFVGKRQSELALRGFMTDVHFLSRCDFIVCTISSNVCRSAYELMQDLHVDASSYFHSLDFMYRLSEQKGHDQVALYPHEAQNSGEISFQPGDLIHVAVAGNSGNHWDGYSTGANQRSKTKMGLFPSYKAEKKVEIARMPIYEEANSYGEKN